MLFVGTCRLTGWSPDKENNTVDARSESACRQFADIEPGKILTKQTNWLEDRNEKESKVYPI